MSSALFGFFLNSDCVRIKYSTTKDCDDAGNEKYHKKFLVIIISQNQCDKHHARDFHILTQSIIFFSAELTDQTDLLGVILLLLRYMALWSILRCASYCTVLALCYLSRAYCGAQTLKITRTLIFFAGCHLFYQYGCNFKSSVFEKITYRRKN